MHAMSGSKGYAMLIRNTSNNMYTALQQSRHKSTTSAAWNWDGASYGGLSVNVAGALDCDTLNFSYVKPMVFQIPKLGYFNKMGCPRVAFGVWGKS